MEKVYVDHNNQIKIICPKCGLEKKINVFKFKNTHKKLKAKCKCGEDFRITLDFRKYYRKNARLSGKYFVKRKNETREIIIEDISKTGIKFVTLEPHYFSKGDLVELKIILDTQMRMEVRTSVKIIWIIDLNVGAQFINPKLLEKDLGLYLIK
jgi:PilZ domain